MTVVGAARSGIAAAELLARRRARVTLTEMRPEATDAEPLRRLGVQLELGGHRTETLTHADLVVLSPGVPPDQPAIQEARERGVPIIGELELASRWLHGRVVAITGHEGEVDDDGADGSDARSGRVQGDRGRQHRRAAERAGGGVDAGHGARRRSQQLSARADRDVSSVDCRDAEFFARPSRSASDRGRLRRREGQDFRKSDGRRLGGHQRRRPGRPRAGAAGDAPGSGCSRGGSRSSTARRSRTAGSSIDAAGLSAVRRSGRVRHGSCRSTRSICSDRIWSTT